MNRFASLLYLTLVLVSCGVDNDHFRIEGRLRHLNQGEFYIYSLTDGIAGTDTIKVESGRFAYELPCEKAMTMVIVFPNFSEQPVFAEPGKGVTISGDASLLKEMTVKGTKDNELMNGFREQIVSASPPEMAKYAAQFIQDHPESVVSNYLLRRYFIAFPKPDYKQAQRLIKLLEAAQPKNGSLIRLSRQVDILAKTATGNMLPNFKGYALNGETVSAATFRNAPYGVISVWASWSYESLDMQRMLQNSLRKARARMKVVSICVDASKRECRDAMKRDSVSWPTVCDEQMLEGRMMHDLGLYQVPGNILLKNGRIIARDLSKNDLEKKLNELIP